MPPRSRWRSASSWLYHCRPRRRRSTVPHGFFGVSPAAIVGVKELEAMRRAGIESVRFPIFWPIIQPQARRGRPMAQGPGLQALRPSVRRGGPAGNQARPLRLRHAPLPDARPHHPADPQPPAGAGMDALPAGARGAVRTGRRCLETEPRRQAAAGDGVADLERTEFAQLLDTGQEIAGGLRGVAADLRRGAERRARRNAGHPRRRALHDAPVTG